MLPTVIFFWDYDGEFGGERSWDNPRRGVGYLEYEATVRLLDILDEFMVKAVFAFVGCAATPGPLPYHALDQIREVHRRGHEVASHGWQHEWLPAFDPRHLVQIVRWSKEALEEATGEQVLSFVPPWNAPYRFLARASLGLGELRRSWRNPTDLPRLCEVLCQVGFRICRAGYEPLPWTLYRWVTGRSHLHRPAEPLWVNGMLLIPPNTPGGFGARAQAVLERTVQEGGLCVFWAHPHSLLGNGPQGEAALREVLGKIRQYEGQGRLRVITARELLSEQDGK